MDTKNKKRILISAVMIFIIAIVGYWSYLTGVSASQQATAAIYMVMVQQQYDCLKRNDIECVKLTNEFMADFVSYQVKALKNSRMDVGFDQIADEYLVWYDSIKKTK